ncbi:alpha/beta fold hydrolase [Rubellicoccus peritrichatus]|uniref:Alpha/beta fold hydrolase n=1 Tax=Rubellicoccus peritrichatus TaxID=3080537 RepID=A0AAQ3L8L2_9BACT|nr:alpha/beta fold hydrolase [Puniceicoccus sp. CR14]WOO41330.1 alpha/beta fold hydrolase [Puniceicoccus sp. CR14]
MRTHLLHGNIQTPAVWGAFLEQLPGKLALVDLRDYSADNCAAWARAFNEKVTQELESDEKHFLVGYSLGGRLALHALLENHKLWCGAVIIGAHPGSDDPSQREVWLKNDHRWAERFLKEPWDVLLKEWDALPVFGGIPNPCPRNKEDFDRNEVARTFLAFSKGQQAYLTPRLREPNLPPVLYLSGEQDAVYSKLGRDLSEQCPAIRHEVIPRAAHRVPWENPDAFIETVKQFLDQS